MRSRLPIEDEIAELWRSTDAVGFLRAWTTGQVDQGEHARHTGNRLVEVPGAGSVVMTWTPGQQLANLSGAVHGGYLALVCDESAGLAAASTGERFIPMLTLDLDVTYLRPGVVGSDHRVEGQVLHAGRARIISEARIYAPSGKLAATARGSFLPNKAFGVA
ncbi:MAG: thioesterase superfamily protein [Frankiales bacterium]|nr:thioesterase superfamily protein [Frankiales bacterium]